MTDPSCDGPICEATKSAVEQRTLKFRASDRPTASKRVRLPEEAYERPKALRRDDETISAVVLPLAGERSFLELAGILSDEQADPLEHAVEDRRRRSRTELESVLTRTVADFERMPAVTVKPH